jgi:uncharacterized protein (DUF3084 family)
MKKYFLLSMLISFAMICSCQKQDSAVEQQLDQRKTELDTREEALVERENVLNEREKKLDQREKALAKNGKAAANDRMTTPAQSPDMISDPVQAKAERDREIQETVAKFRAMVPDSGKDRITKERLSQAQDALKELMSKKQTTLQMSGARASSAPQATSPTASPTPQ